MTSQQESHAAQEAPAQRRGIIVIAVLAVLTVIEFIIAVTMDGGNWLATLLGIAGLLKAILILQYFMHFHQLWHTITEVWDAVIYGEEAEAND